MRHSIIVPFMLLSGIFNNSIIDARSKRNRSNFESTTSTSTTTARPPKRQKHLSNHFSKTKKRNQSEIRPLDSQRPAKRQRFLNNSTQTKSDIHHDRSPFQEKSKETNNEDSYHQLKFPLKIFEEPEVEESYKSSIAPQEYDHFGEDRLVGTYVLHAPYHLGQNLLFL